MPDATRAGLPRRVWLYAILGGLWILVATRLVSALAERPQLELALTIAAVAVTFAVVRWIFGQEFSRAEKVRQELRASQRQLAAVQEGSHADSAERKRAEQALRESEEKYRTLVKHLPLPLFTKDREGVFTSVSENFAALLSLRPEDIVGKTDYDLCPRELADNYRQNDQEVMATGQLKEVEEPYETQGERRWARSIKVPFRDAEGRCVGVLGMLADITARKQTETALVHSETQLRLVWESAHDAMRLTDRAGTLLRVNEAFCRLVGRPREELEDRPLTALFPESQRDAVLREHEKHFLSGAAVSFKKQVTLADGKQLRLEVNNSLLRLPGQPDLALTVLRDITERERAEQARRFSEERHQTLFEAITDALFVHELNEDGSAGRIVEVNDVACERLGYTREELLHMSLRDISPPETGTETAFISKRLRDGFTPRYEQVHVTKDGVRIPVEVHARLFALQGCPVVLSLVRDITERNRAEEAVRASEARLIEVLQIARLGHWEYDPHTELVRSSDETYALLNTNAQREGGYQMSFADFIRRFVHPGDALLFRENLQRVLENPADRRHLEFRLMQRDGHVRWCSVQARATKDAAGRTLKVAGSIQDITERKEAEQELQRQNAFRSAVVQHATEGIGVCQELPEAPFLVFTVWNERMTQITGYTVEEINQRGWYQTMFPDPSAQTRARQRMREMRAGQDQIGQEWEITRADGQRRVLSVSTSVLPLSDGPRQVLAVMQDITERKRVEAQLRLQHSALEAAANSIVITDSNGCIIWVNDAFTTLTGYCRWEAIGHSSRLLKSGKHGPEFYRQMWGTILAGRTWRGELANRRKDGTLYHEEMTITAVRDASGQIAHFIAIKQDVSKRREFEQRLQEQARLLDLAQDAIFVTDLQDRVEDWYAGAERFYGWTRDEAIGRPVPDLIYKDKADFQAAWDHLQEQGHWEGELPQVRKDGMPVVAFCRWTLVKDEQGAPRAVLAINADITTRKALEAQMLRAQRLEGIGQLAGGIAHDLNNILTPILLSAQMMKTDADEKKRKMLDGIERNAKKGADVLRQLLTFARGTKGERVPVSPQRLVRDVLRMITETFPKAIEIRSTIPDDISPILGDPTQLHQVLLNLCLNARDAMPNGGTLTLTVGNVQVDKTWTEVNPQAKPGRYVAIGVADTGSGIKPEDMERIFLPFFTTKAHGQGTGFGLAIVYSIVKNHHGFTEVRSEVGVGSSFRVLLPVSQQPILVTDAAPPPLARGRGELVLVVDDEESVRAVAKAALERYGYRTLTAVDGRDAVALFVQQRPNLTAAVVDVDMPNMDGLALSDALLSLRPDLRLIVMTGGFSNEAKEARFRSLGVVQFLRKPFTTEELLKALRDIIDAPPLVRTATPA